MLHVIPHSMLQLGRKGERVHECDGKQILWPVGPPLQHVPVNRSPRHIAALVMRASFCISDDKTVASRRAVLVRQRDVQS